MTLFLPLTLFLLSLILHSSVNEMQQYSSLIYEFFHIMNIVIKDNAIIKYNRPRNTNDQ